MIIKEPPCPEIVANRGADIGRFHLPILLGEPEDLLGAINIMHTSADGLIAKEGAYKPSLMAMASRGFLCTGFIPHSSSLSPGVLEVWMSDNNAYLTGSVGWRFNTAVVEGVSGSRTFRIESRAVGGGSRYSSAIKEAQRRIINHFPEHLTYFHRFLKYSHDNRRTTTNAGAMQPSSGQRVL
jgi:hypothetical protein